MGFTGDLVLARSDRPLPEHSLFGNEFVCGEGHGDCVHVFRPYQDGWQVLHIRHGLPGGDRDQWLSRLVTATGVPAMLATAVDSDACEVSGLTPNGVDWSAVLDPAMAGEVGGAAAQTSETVGRIIAWATETRCSADRARLVEALTKPSGSGVEGLFLELIAACGLTAQAEPEAPPATPDQDDADGSAAQSPFAHPGHCPTADCPRGPALELAVQNLRRGGHLVLECSADPNCYAQVWLRPDGAYQLEYRDRSPAEHYQTQTMAPEEVATALAGWTVGEVGWRESFQWTSIGSWFSDTAEA